MNPWAVKVVSIPINEFAFLGVFVHMNIRRILSSGKVCRPFYRLPDLFKSLPAGNLINILS